MASSSVGASFLGVTVNRGQICLLRAGLCLRLLAVARVEVLAQEPDRARASPIEGWGGSR